MKIKKLLLLIILTVVLTTAYSQETVKYIYGIVHYEYGSKPKLHVSLDDKYEEIKIEAGKVNDIFFDATPLTTYILKLQGEGWEVFNTGIDNRGGYGYLIYFIRKKI